MADNSPINHNTETSVDNTLTDLASIRFSNDSDDDHVPFGFPILSSIAQTNQPFLYPSHSTHYQPQPQPQPQEQMIESHVWNSQAGSSLVSPVPDQTPSALQVPKKSNRKKQKKKVVCEMTDEEVVSDSWAWRKYGQKTIKGTPHPRNYFRCNIGKGCSARKHVERSLTNPEKLVVTFSSDHTHPQLSHLNYPKAGDKNTAENSSMDATPPLTVGGECHPPECPTEAMAIEDGALQN